MSNTTELMTTAGRIGENGGLPINSPSMLPNIELGSLVNEADTDRAVGAILNGGVVAAEWRGSVIGLYMDAENRPALDSALEIKGDPNKDKTFSSMIPYKYLFPFIDMSKVHQDLKGLLANVDKWPQIIGSLVHVAYPLNEQGIEAIPKSIRSGEGSNQTIYNIDPTGNEQMANFIEKARGMGLEYLAVTALGVHGQPEYTTIAQATNHLIGSDNLSLLLEHQGPTYPEVNGSLTIIDITEARVIRDGHIPHKVVSELLGIKLETEGMQPAKHDQVCFDALIELANNSPELRKAVISFIQSS